MKQVFSKIIIPVVVLFGLSCKNDCEPTIITCNENPPRDELCQAAFNRWFYNKDKNRCEQIAYNGCSEKGFATKQECDQCECNN